MTEREKMQQGLLYDANYDAELLAERTRCKDLCFAYNQLQPSLGAQQEEIIRRLLGKTGERFCITAPFWCDYGWNIEIGENFYTNHNCVILDGARVTFGDNVCLALGRNYHSVGGYPFEFEIAVQPFDIALREYPVSDGCTVKFDDGMFVVGADLAGHFAFAAAGIGGFEFSCHACSR